VPLPLLPRHSQGGVIQASSWATPQFQHRIYGPPPPAAAAVASGMMPGPIYSTVPTLHLSHIPQARYRHLCFLAILDKARCGRWLVLGVVVVVLSFLSFRFRHARFHQWGPNIMPIQPCTTTPASVSQPLLGGDENEDEGEDLMAAETRNTEANARRRDSGEPAFKLPAFCMFSLWFLSMIYFHTMSLPERGLYR